jgi:branched-chain amino acid transport system ATP-binding protein
MTDPVLATRSLTKSFGALQASRDISLTLQPGEIHAVIGPNGAGKSTLIAQICGSLMPDAGEVEFLGQNVTTLPTRKRARMGLARTFQISALAMEDTVLQNVTLGALGARGGALDLIRNALKDKDLRDTAMAALERVNLAQEASTVTAELSHGQRRQLEVAVALTLGPRAFVMDEPMAGMGTEGSHRMTTFLDELRAEAPILLVEHDMDAVFALADRLSVLVYGEIIATGTVEEIRANQAVRAAYLGETA